MMEWTRTSQTPSELDYNTSAESTESSIKITISVEGVDHDVSDRAFLDAIREALVTRYTKRADYNRGNITYLDYFPCGEASAVHTLFCKSQRLVSIVTNPNGDGAYDTVNESIDDAYVDLIVYAGFAWGRRLLRGEVQTPSTPPPA